MAEDKPLNKFIQSFAADVAKRFRKPVQAQVKAHDRQVAEWQIRWDKPAKQVESLKAELAAAEDYLANIPISAQPGDIALQQTIADKWPARINEVAADLAPLTIEKRDIDFEHRSEMNRLQSDIYVEESEAKYDIEKLRVNVRDLA